MSYFALYQKCQTLTEKELKDFVYYGKKEALKIGLEIYL